MPYRFIFAVFTLSRLIIYLPLSPFIFSDFFFHYLMLFSFIILLITLSLIISDYFSIIIMPLSLSFAQHECFSLFLLMLISLYASIFSRHCCLPYTTPHAAAAFILFLPFSIYDYLLVFSRCHCLFIYALPWCCFHACCYFRWYCWCWFSADAGYHAGCHLIQYAYCWCLLMLFAASWCRLLPFSDYCRRFLSMLISIAYFIIFFFMLCLRFFCWYFALLMLLRCCLMPFHAAADFSADFRRFRFADAAPLPLITRFRWCLSLLMPLWCHYFRRHFFAAFAFAAIAYAALFSPPLAGYLRMIDAVAFVADVSLFMMAFHACHDFSLFCCRHFAAVHYFHYTLRRYLSFHYAITPYVFAMMLLLRCCLMPLPSIARYADFSPLMPCAYYLRCHAFHRCFSLDVSLIFLWFRFFRWFSATLFFITLLISIFFRFRFRRYFIFIRLPMLRWFSMMLIRHAAFFFARCRFLPLRWFRFLWWDAIDAAFADYIIFIDITCWWLPMLWRFLFRHAFLLSLSFSDAMPCWDYWYFAAITLCRCFRRFYFADAIFDVWFSMLISIFWLRHHAFIFIHTLTPLWCPLTPPFSIISPDYFLLLISLLIRLFDFISALPLSMDAAFQGCRHASCH